jgi:type IV secretory pathway TraG/TraD family ATPase VirD4
METFLANSGFRIFFAPRDKTTSDYISDMCGVGEAR